MPKLPEFYKEKEWDALFFGTSEIYSALDPEIFDEYGIKSYNRGRPKQTVYHTYYYMKDAFEVADVKVAILETHAFAGEIKAGEYLTDEIEDGSLNDLRFSPVKVEAIIKCSAPEKWARHLLYLDAFHSRWEEFCNGTASFSADELILPNNKKENRGYHPFDNVNVRPSYPSIDERFTTEPYEKDLSHNKYWFDKMVELCEAKGVKLIVMKAPWPCYSDEIKVNNEIEKWCLESDVPFINYMQKFEEIGLDYTTDCTDEDGHTNISGANKISRHMAAFVKEYMEQE